MAGLFVHYTSTPKTFYLISTIGDLVYFYMEFLEGIQDLQINRITIGQVG